MDDIIGQASTSALDSSETKEENNDYSPDEEDVENQLMHIDDRLIRIDENIDGLDQQLLSVEEENFLFESMPDLTPSMTMSDAVEYQHDQEIEELIAAGLPSPLMPSPFLIDADEAKDVEPIENPVIKQVILNPRKLNWILFVNAHFYRKSKRKLLTKFKIGLTNKALLAQPTVWPLRLYQWIY